MKTLPILYGGIAVVLLTIIGFWQIFKKAGKPGWAAIIPIFNIFVFLDIVGKPGWWFILFLIPPIGIVFQIMAYHQLSKCFGKGAGYTIGMLFLPFIFFPVLGLGSAQYTDPIQGS